jgi:hypothetical protein
MAEMFRWLNLSPGRQFDGHHGANVRNREMVSADELIAGKSRITPCKEMRKPKTPTFRERRNLFKGYGAGQGSALQAWSRISKGLLRCIDGIPFDPPQPAFDDGSFLCAPPHQGRIGVQLFEVAAYRNDVGDRSTVIEFEDRNRTIGIEGAECRRELFAAAQIDLHGRHGKTFLGKENTYATRAWCGCAVVELHGGTLSNGRGKLGALFSDLVGSVVALRCAGRTSYPYLAAGKLVSSACSVVSVEWSAMPSMRAGRK